MSNKAIAITIVILLAATGYLLFKSDGDIDMGGEKHGAEAIQSHDNKKDEKPEEKK